MTTHAPLPEFKNIVKQFVQTCFESCPNIQHCILIYTLVYQTISDSSQNWSAVHDCLQTECQSFFQQKSISQEKFERGARQLAHAFAYVDRTKGIACQDGRNVKPVYEMISTEYHISLIHQ